MTYNLKIHNRIKIKDSKESLHACEIVPTELQQTSIVIFSHGFSVSGTESGRHFLSLAENLAANGIPALLFDYRGSGYSDGLFEDMSFESVLLDLSSVIDHAKHRHPEKSIIVWGESFGAAVAAHVAYERHDISALVLWSLSANLFERYHKRFGPVLGESKTAFIDGGLRISRDFINSLKGKDTIGDISKLTIPSLLVHGDADTTSSIELSQEAHNRAPKHTSLVEIHGGNHGFESQLNQFSEAKNASFEWLLKQINK